jgi:hypothetical protein
MSGKMGLFFTRFRFTLSYRPGSQNVKADALGSVHRAYSHPSRLEADGTSGIGGGHGHRAGVTGRARASSVSGWAEVSGTN